MSGKLYTNSQYVTKKLEKTTEESMKFKNVVRRFFFVDFSASMFCVVWRMNDFLNSDRTLNESLVDLSENDCLKMSNKKQYKSVIFLFQTNLFDGNILKFYVATDSM